MSHFPNGFILPTDLKQQLDAGIPLLDTQFKRFRKEISLFLQELHTPPRQTEPIHDIGIASDSNEQFVLDLFQEIGYSIEQQENVSWDLTYEHQKAIEYYLQKGVSSAWVLCELLVKEHNAPKVRYATRKSKMYVPVCMYLDELVKRGTIRLVEIDGKLDRVYQR